MAATGESAPRRQGAVAADTTASAIAPLVVGGIYKTTPAAVSDTSDATILLTDNYGRLETVQSVRGTASLSLLASGCRTATCSVSDQTNYSARGVMLFFNVTAAASPATVTLSVTGKDPISGSYVTLLDGTGQDATGMNAYCLYPGVADTESKFEAFEEMPLPLTWRATVTHDTAGSAFTYSLGGFYLV